MRLIAACSFVACTLVVWACTDKSTAVVSGPVAAATARPSFNLTTTSTTTTWDFVQLSGGDGPQGSPKTYTIAGQGSIVASASATAPNPGFQVYSKGFEDAPMTNERGLGICGNYGTGGACGSASPGGDDEIGDTYPDASGNQTVIPSLFLDLTGLVSGAVVESVTVSSVQQTEGYSISWSTDGSAYTLLVAGTGNSATNAVYSFAVPSGAKYLRFDQGPGGGGNNYLLQSVTVQSSSSTPTGKTFSIGPSSMEGAILISNGDWVNGGYSFSFANGGHAATNFFVHASVSLTGPCVGGGPATDTFSFDLNDATYAVAAGNTNWLPTGDQNSVLSWQGSVRASGVCGGIGKLNASHGAVFTATVSQDPPTGSLVNWRFKYRDPAAKGKPNTNCLDTSDPNRARADVCGASWSQTVRDP
jgi:hypothetical protein